MSKYTFTVTDVVGKEGNHYPLLTSKEYPYMNIQVVPTPDDQRERIMAALEKRGGWIMKADGRDDFVVIHAGGGRKIKITQQNVDDVTDAMKECLQAGAGWWAENGEDYRKA